MNLSCLYYLQVEYCSMNWKKVDYICTLYGQRVGVSVTRAMSYPDPEQFSPDMANKLLHKKLFGLVRWFTHLFLYWLENIIFQDLQ